MMAQIEMKDASEKDVNVVSGSITQDQQRDDQDSQKAHLEHQQLLAKAQEEKQPQREQARAISTPNPRNLLKIYPLNKYSGKQGRHQFDIKCIEDEWKDCPEGLKDELKKTVLVSQHFGKAAMYYPDCKVLGHPEKGMFTIRCYGNRIYANGTKDSRRRSQGLIYFEFKDDIDIQNHHKEPMSNEAISHYLQRRLKEIEGENKKIELLRDYGVVGYVHNVLLYQLNQKMQNLSIQETITLIRSLSSGDFDANTLLSEAVKDIFTKLDPVSFQQDYGKLLAKGQQEDIAAKERYTGLKRQTARRGNLTYRLPGARAYGNRSGDMNTD